MINIAICFPERLFQLHCHWQCLTLPSEVNLKNHEFGWCDSKIANGRDQIVDFLEYKGYRYIWREHGKCLINSWCNFQYLAVLSSGFTVVTFLTENLSISVLSYWKCTLLSENTLKFTVWSSYCILYYFCDCSIS